MADLDALFAAARDLDPRLRHSAALRLGTLRPGAKTGKNSDPGSGDDIDDSLVPGLVELLLTETDPFVLETLTWAVVARGGAAVPHLLTALADDDAEHVRVLHTLSKIEDPATVTAIVPFVDDDRPAVASKAWWALARIADPETFAALASKIGVRDLDQRHALTRAFVQIGPSALPHVTACFDAAEPAVREHALEIAVRTLDPDARGTAQRRAITRGEKTADLLTTTHDALVRTPAPEAHAVLTQLSYEFQRPPLSALAEELLEHRRKLGR